MSAPYARRRVLSPPADHLDRIDRRSPAPQLEMHLRLGH
jgi:hypothetical protein